MLTLGRTKTDYAKIIGVNLRTLQRKMKDDPHQQFWTLS
ncbi:hypothetical protein [Vibrio parahaemolyticus]|nr:hypothetical protein [Vibrio parahaemolyticus]